MKSRSVTWLVAMALTAAVAGAGADDQTSPLSTLGPGDRVRVEVVGNRETLTATIESVTADELFLRSVGADNPCASRSDSSTVSTWRGGGAPSGARAP